MIDLVKVGITEKEKSLVREVLDSGIIAQGPKVGILEEKFAGLCRVKHAIATSNGTTALHLALLASGIKPGDEVITVPFTFVASANSIRMCGATPRFADIREDTFNIDPEKIEDAITEKTKAIMPVHIYGQVCEMDKIQSIAKRHGLKIIEDSAQAVGASFDGRMAGSFGDASAFSLYATKNITSAEGGIVTTDSDSINQLCRLLRHHGQDKQYEYSVLGYNYRLTDVQAAIAIPQLERIDEINRKRRENARKLTEGLKNIKGIETPYTDKRCFHVYHQYTIKVTRSHKLSRDKFREQLKLKGVNTGVYYPKPLHLHPAFADLGYTEGDFLVSCSSSSQVVSLPCHPFLSDNDISTIISAIREIS